MDSEEAELPEGRMRATQGTEEEPKQHASGQKQEVHEKGAHSSDAQHSHGEQSGCESWLLNGTRRNHTGRRP